MREAAKLLKEAREVIRFRRRWVQGHFALDGHGNVVKPDDNAAVCWCASGAMRKVGNNNAWYSVARAALLNAVTGPNSGSLGRYNDNHTHAEVLEMFDDAIAALEDGE